MPGVDDFVPVVIDVALRDPSIKVRRVATYELGNACPDGPAITALEAQLAQEPDRVIRHFALTVLNKLPR